MKPNKLFLGECIGTFILVFIGCGIVGLSLLDESISLLVIALTWGAAVFLGILASHKWSHAHLNPAVSFGFWLYGSVNRKEMLVSMGGQFVGAIIAAVTLLLGFNNKLAGLEEANGWDRAEVSGWNTGKMFGEYYDPILTPLGEGFMIEAFGTLVLMFMILMYTRNMEQWPWLSFLFIGLTVSILIMFIAPITQCGINPARDLGPRLVSLAGGWKKSFDLPEMGAIIVYVIGPFVGAGLAIPLYRLRNLIWKD